MRFTLRQIEAVLAVAELGNFSRAAERLGSTQPALSQAVRDLEAELDVRLFDRTTRRVELTEAGRAFRDQAAKGLDEIDRAVGHARDLAALRRGRIHIAAPPLLAAAVLPQAIVEFRAEHPGVDVAVEDVGTDRIVAGVASGQADLGIGTFQSLDPGLERLPIIRDDLMLFCPPDHPLAASPAPGWRDLAGEPLIALTRESGIRLLVEIGFETVEQPLRPAHEVHQIATALALVAAGLGVTVLPTYALAAAEGRAVVGRSLADPVIGREVVVIHPSDRALSPAARAFTDRLRRVVRRLSPPGP
ncbi:LysR family transcriptional regulator [Acidimangrovimonas pyrenivorans]|uniref:LysR family transcriptional regulator n=1 Tax=Acidimangrovimonas pyrenivorans TaxID=2030798 RepID=A0ABV7AIT0_9RHOB